jgi:hypothetical protein
MEAQALCCYLSIYLPILFCGDKEGVTVGTQLSHADGHAQYPLQTLFGVDVVQRNGHSLPTLHMTTNARNPCTEDDG